MKSFNYWIRQEVEEVFGVKQVKKHILLEKWLRAKCELSEKEKIRLEELRSNLEENVELWNEAELKMKFLGALLDLVKYDTPNYRAFMERPLFAKIGNEKSSGTVDFLIARGKQVPRTPFFSIHEYKPELGAYKDPYGQLMIALIAIYQTNQKEGFNFPLYGAYVTGKFFYFVVFDGTTFAKSKHYTATEKEIFDIFCILKQVKIYIQKIIAEETKT